MIKRGVWVVVAMSLWLVNAAQGAEGSSPSAEVSSAHLQGVALATILEDFAKRSGKRVIVDARVRADVVVFGMDTQRLSLRDLQAILAMHGFVALTDAEGTINIIPDAIARAQMVPLLTGSRSDPSDYDLVTKIIPVGKLDAAQLVPPLRPMLPQYAHLVAIQDSNALLVVARYYNVKIIEAVVRELESKARAVPATEVSPSR